MLTPRAKICIHDCRHENSFKAQEASELRAAHGANGEMNCTNIWFTPRWESKVCSHRVSDFHADFPLLVHVNVSNYPHHVSLGNVSCSSRSKQRATIIDSNSNPQLTAKLICLRCCLHGSYMQCTFAWHRYLTEGSYVDLPITQWQLSYACFPSRHNPQEFIKMKM